MRTTCDPTNHSYPPPIVRAFALAAACVFGLSACKTQMTYESLNTWVNSHDAKAVGGEVEYPKPEQLNVPAGQSIAFIRYHQNLGPAKPTYTEPFLHVRIVDLKTNKIRWAIPRQYSGIFPHPPVGDFHDILLWFLPPGEYSILDVEGVKTANQVLSTSRESKTSPINARFKVENTGEILYLTDFSAIGKGLDYEVSIKDNYADAIQEFHHTYVNATGTDVNASVRQDPVR
jgi:hypothetical protein